MSRQLKQPLQTPIVSEATHKPPLGSFLVDLLNSKKEQFHGTLSWKLVDDAARVPHHSLKKRLRGLPELKRRSSKESELDTVLHHSSHHTKVDGTGLSTSVIRRRYTGKFNDRGLSSSSLYPPPPTVRDDISATSSRKQVQQPPAGDRWSTSSNASPFFEDISPSLPAAPRSSPTFSRMWKNESNSDSSDNSKSETTIRPTSRRDRLDYTIPFPSRKPMRSNTDEDQLSGKVTTNNKKASQPKLPSVLSGFVSSTSSIDQKSASHSGKPESRSPRLRLSPPQLQHEALHEFSQRTRPHAPLQYNLEQILGAETDDGDDGDDIGFVHSDC